MITKNKVVAVHYKLYEDSIDGDLIEQTYDTDPLQFLFGVGQMIPGFEAHLEGKNQGDTFGFTLTPDDAYGPYEEQAVIEVALDNFRDESGTIDAEKIFIGGLISMEDHEGRIFQGEIVDMPEEVVVIDFNHPMAGATLHFVGEIVEIREATDTEIEHQHVH